MGSAWTLSDQRSHSNSDHDRCEHGLAILGLELVKELVLGTPSSMEVKKCQGNMEKLLK